MSASLQLFSAVRATGIRASELRDLAIMSDKKNIHKSHLLMTVAFWLKPEGPLIKKKHQEYIQSMAGANRFLDRMHNN